MTKAQITQANTLATTLDLYNNNKVVPTTAACATPVACPTCP